MDYGERCFHSRKVQARGGTIADVAVATLLCMGVVLPHSMGMGGGFLATVYTRYSALASPLEQICM